MPWTPLSHRIGHLPLILAGPILRRTQPDAVTVWIALKQPCEVVLKVYTTDPEQGAVKQLVFAGAERTVALGQYLHVVAVTATSVNQQQLQPEQIYAYDLSCGSQDSNLLQALNSSKLTPAVSISYFPHQLPTFAMPPENLDQLRIVHGSCRKPHGGQQDALPILDDLIEASAKLPHARPHQLFLTGDQIYGDDVADPLLWALTDAGDTLLGWTENLPLRKQSAEISQWMQPCEIKPGQRSEVAKEYGGFTAMLSQTPEEAKSHLFGLGEYYSMYLFVWSEVLWTQGFPDVETLYTDPKLCKRWDAEVVALQDFARDLWKVRRALANVPTYMIFDDHDISDDWYLNRFWCNRVLSQPLGRRVLQNGLLAYAAFQAWGNTPNQFQVGQPGQRLLTAAQQWSASKGTDAVTEQAIADAVGLPLSSSPDGSPNLKQDEDVLVLDRDYPDGTPTLKWHYTVSSLKHEVIVLDTRTWRGYPPGEGVETHPPMLLSPTAFAQQLQEPLEHTDQQRSPESQIEATLVVAPTNLVSLEIIDLIQQWELKQGKVFNNDVGDAWNINKAAFAKLLTTLLQRRQRVIVLSGDIHYGCAVRLSYWSRADAAAEPDPPETAHVLAQLTSSALKNAEWKTQVIHTKVKSIAPERPQSWVGWDHPPQLIEILTMPGSVQQRVVQVPKQTPLMRKISGSQGNEAIAWELAVQSAQSLPDWRYHIEWIKRGSAQSASWNKPEMFSKPSRSDQSSWRGIGSLISCLWHHPWVQEGEEVVGENNLGLISFCWSLDDTNKAVIQDIYWRPAWNPRSTVFSRYVVPLNLDAPPPPLRVIS